MLEANEHVLKKLFSWRNSGDSGLSLSARTSLFSRRRRAVDFVSDQITVNLDLHEVCLLLAETDLTDLGVYGDTNDGPVFTDMLEFACNISDTW